MMGNLRHFALLLLLAQWGPMSLLRAQPPPGLTRAKWFEIQHIQINPPSCNQAMGAVNRYKQYCKKRNTFLHDTLPNVAAVCHLRSIRCKNGLQNCHRSAQPVNKTYCRLTGGTYPNCQYSDVPQYNFFVVACAPRQNTDPPYPLLPVHLD